MVTESAAVIIREIEAAFAQVEHPGDQSLLHSQCMDDHDIDIEDFYGDIHWRDVPDDIIERNNASLRFFSPEAFRFYLPAFLTWVLRNFAATDSFTVDSTIYSLDPGDDDLGDFAKSKYSLLDHRQRTAVANLLNYLKANGQGMVDEDAVKKALLLWQEQ